MPGTDRRALWDDLALGSDGPRARGASLVGRARARGIVVSVSVDIGTASVSMCATSVRGDRQRQPQPPPQYCEQAVGKAVLTGDGAEPMPQRSSGLGNNSVSRNW